MKTEKFIVKNLGYPFGYIIMLLTLFRTTIYWYGIWSYGFIGYVIKLSLMLLTIYIDIKTSNAHEYNMQIMEKNGYDSKKIVKKCIINSLVGDFFFNFLNMYLVKDAVPYFNITLIIKLFISLVVSELYFYFLHRKLHQSYPEIHKLHHCCVRPSFITGFIFESNDSFFELTVPNLILIVLNSVIFRDPFAFMCAQAINTIWYVADHDEYLKLPHWFHHKYINSVYGVYIDSKEFDEKDQVRNLIKK